MVEFLTVRKEISIYVGGDSCCDGKLRIIARYHAKPHKGENSVVKTNTFRR